MVRIIVFGGGTSHGLWDKKGGWAERLRNDLYQQTMETQGSDYYELYNLGIRGDNSSSILKRIDEVKPRLEHANEDEKCVLVFQVGANDSQFVYEEDDLRNDPEDFRYNLEEIIEKVAPYADEIMFLGLIPIDDERIKSIPAVEGRSFSTNRMEEYDEIVRDVAEDREAYYIELFEMFDDDFDSLMEDGLHPNTEGHKMIFEAVKERMSKQGIL